MNHPILLSPPESGAAERDALVAAVESGWLAPVGPALDAFEADVAATVERACGVGLTSGTAALHLALLVHGIGPGDDVLVSTFTFAATVNAIAYTGATPVLVDSDADTWNLSPDLLAEELSSRRGRRPKAAVVVDLYGQCADQARIAPLLADHGVLHIVDAAESLGATYQGRPSGAFGDLAVLSFNGNKIITTTGGGMLVTDDAAVAGRVRHLATQAREPVPHYEHVEIGYNYRLSNLLAAFGSAQLTDLERRVARRREVFDRYVAGLASVPGVGFMPEAPYGRSNRWLTCITLDEALSGMTPEALRLHLQAEQIEARPTWKPMHQQPVFKDCPNRLDGTADELFRTGLCLPSGSSLTHDDQDRVIASIRAPGRRVKVVVTGGAGFIGANLCRALAAVDEVDEVVALDDLSTGLAPNLHGVDAALVVGDLVDADVLDAVLPGTAAVVHLGARPSVPRSLEDPLASHHANATGTLQVLEAVRRHRVGHVIVASSSSVYGANPVLPKHEDLVPMPVSPYAVSKLATEAYALAHAASFGIDALAFRFFNVFGPLQAAGHAYAAVVPAFVSAALAGQPVTVHGDGGQTRDFTYIGSVCDVLVGAVCTRATSARPVNLAFGGRASLLELLTALEGILGSPIERRHVDPRPGDVRDSQADQTTLRALFPEVVPVGLDEGLRRTVAWFRTGDVT